MSNAQPKYREIKWIPCKQLSLVWAEAQRPLNEAHARSIADNFDPEMFGTIAVTKPNGAGVYHIIDGQHRKAALEMKYGSEEQAPCQVFDAEDPARAAQLFDTINSHRKAPQPIDLFRVRVTAGEELQTEINRIVLKSGYVVAQRVANSLTCVASLQGVYQSYGPVVLEATLRLIRKTWGDDNTAVAGNIVRGLGSFLSEFRHVDFEVLSKSLAMKYTPARFLGAAKAAKEINGGNLASAVKDLAMRAYNANVRGEKNKLQSKKKND